MSETSEATHNQILSPQDEKQIIIEKEWEEKIARLEREYPGAVIVFAKDTRLYHSARHLEELMKTNKFDSNKSDYDGSIHFSDQPVPSITNCSVKLDRPLVLFDHNIIRFGTPAMQRLQSHKDGYIKGAMEQGFDGQVGSSTSIFLKVNKGKYAKEIVIYPSGLDAIDGSITLFSS